MSQCMSRCMAGISCFLGPSTACCAQDFLCPKTFPALGQDGSSDVPAQLQEGKLRHGGGWELTAGSGTRWLHGTSSCPTARLGCVGSPCTPMGTLSRGTPIPPVTATPEQDRRCVPAGGGGQRDPGDRPHPYASPPHGASPRFHGDRLLFRSPHFCCRFPALRSHWIPAPLWGCGQR